MPKADWTLRGSAHPRDVRNNGRISPKPLKCELSGMILGRTPHFKTIQSTLPPIIMEVKNGCISNSSYLSNIAIFHFHDNGRKSRNQSHGAHNKGLVQYDPANKQRASTSHRKVPRKKEEKKTLLRRWRPS